jgi:hypothetical protein
MVICKEVLRWCGLATRWILAKTAACSSMGHSVGPGRHMCMGAKAVLVSTRLNLVTRSIEIDGK